MIRRATATLLILAVISCASAGDRRHHVFYLHGRIVQDQQSTRPQHPEYGYYEFDEIVAALRERGFTVHAEVRPKGTSVSEGADRVVEHVRNLLRAGVPAERITIVGASMGAAIAFRAAARLRDPELTFALLGPCLSASMPAVAAEEGAEPSGRILVVREESDISSEECPRWTDPRAREVVINTGLDHGFLYRPLAEWLDPVAAWARGRD